MMLPLAFIQFDNPLVLAVILAWILSVTLHEVAHGVAAHFGGDHTIAERGGLSLNPLQYLDPIFSLLLPALFLLMGGIPLPGASTYVRRDLLRGRGWQVAVSLAGPGMNLLLFILLSLSLHPALGWYDPEVEPNTGQIFVACLAVLQLMSVILNLIPVPPLDGFNALAQFLPREWVIKVTTPPMGMILFIAYFAVLWQTPLLWRLLNPALTYSLAALGMPAESEWFFRFSFVKLFAQS